MKKAFAILLVLAIAMVGVFADPAVNPNTLTLQYVISDNFQPAYKWNWSVNTGTSLPASVNDYTGKTYQQADQEGLAADPSTVSVGTNNQGTMEAGYVALKLLDASIFSYSTGTHTATITVGKTDWTNGVAQVSKNTNAVTLSDMMVAAATAGNLHLSASGQVLTVTYDKNVNANNSTTPVAIGYITASWAEATGMDAGTYTATVTITYATT